MILSALRAVVNRIHLDLDYPGRNPFERHNIPGGGGSPSDRTLRAANVQDDLRRRLLGHAARDVHGKYGATNPQLAEARDAMEKALEHLGDIDDSVYREDERLDA